MDKEQRENMAVKQRPFLGGVHYMADGAIAAYKPLSSVIKAVSVCTAIVASAVMLSTVSVNLPLPLAVIGVVCGTIVIAAGAAAVVGAPATFASAVAEAVADNIAGKTKKYKDDVSPVSALNMRRLGAVLMAAFSLGVGTAAVYEVFDTLSSGYKTSMRSYALAEQPAVLAEIRSGAITAKFNPTTRNGGPSITLVTTRHGVNQPAHTLNV